MTMHIQWGRGWENKGLGINFSETYKLMFYTKAGLKSTRALSHHPLLPTLSAENE